MTDMPPNIEQQFQATRRALGQAAWERLAAAGNWQALPELIAEHAPDAPAWLAELAAVELACELVRRRAESGIHAVEAMAVNPALQLLPVSWRGLPNMVRGGDAEPQPGEAFVLVWASPAEDAHNVLIRCEEATSEDLLALKVVAEDIPLEEVAREALAPAAAVKALLRRVVDKGLLLAPASRIVRDPASHPRPHADREESVPAIPMDAFVSQSFVLQWHITQRCDLHCKHCYDRSERGDVSLDDGLRLLDDLAGFCEDRHVLGQATFTGGNPLLHPHFLDFYAAAVERDLAVALLANPCGEKQLDAMLDIAMPAYFQVSLEGLEEHNDAIRGPGHFRRTLAFLELLGERGVPSQVMLTLTRGNKDQVIPLARALHGLADTFTFNRLAPVGEGAALACADTAGYASFLREYLEEAGRLGHLSFKDNHFNALRSELGASLSGGCTGFGCGAAFNFLAVLSDGAVHACRKMHSPVGSVASQSLAEVYDGGQAAAYRRGSAACAGCNIRPVCGGCMAVVAGLGLDPFTTRDPYCFYKSAPPINASE